ncbi:MAG: hypothetical protein HN849_35490 [Victivallales bacterium]|nr:hypothetical protein [Victivallales bacterium]
MGTWRDHARPIIAAVIAEHQGETKREVRRALRDAYPYGERKYHPYKVWCDEVNRQLRIAFAPEDVTEGLPLFETNNKE